MKNFSLIREQFLLEKLKKSDPTSKWISDFVHSDNPKFANKSKKERIRMALGAKYAAMRNEQFVEYEEVLEQHYCAKHVYSDLFGEGIVMSEEHAEPDSSGNIEWYTVKFDHGTEIVYTEDLDILMAEYHNNHKKKEKKEKGDIKDDMNEKLHPNKQKIDVHEPEKDEITAADFAKLRKIRNSKGK